MSDRNVVFTPISLDAYKLSNRIIMSSPSRLRALNNVPTEMMATYYAQRASAGMIISEPTLVSPGTTAEQNNCPGIYNQEQIEAWRKVTKAVRDRGGKIFLQLWYGEGISVRDLDRKFYSFDPNATRSSNATLLEIIQHLRRGAQNGLAADFDGVEINAAFGYILDRYFPQIHYQTPEAAKKGRDRRSEFLTDAIDSIASVWDYERVGVRICPSNLWSGNGESDPESTFYYIIDSLNYLDLAYVHLLEPPQQQSCLTIKYEHITELFRPIYKGKLIVEGDDDPEKAIEIVADRNADLISFKDAFVANPNLPLRLQQNNPLNILDTKTIYGGGEKGYLDYPFSN